jgi:hypothetical protein
MMKMKYAVIQMITLFCVHTINTTPDGSLNLTSTTYHVGSKRVFPLVSCYKEKWYLIPSNNHNPLALALPLPKTP